MIAATSQAVSNSSDTPISIVSSLSYGDSLIAPLAVHIDLTSTTSPETSKPFHELYCHVDWDDTAVNFSSPTAGARSDLSKKETFGLVGAHVYEDAGSYTPIITVFDGTNIEQQSVGPIVVADPDTAFDEIHFFSADTTYAAGTPATGGKYTRHDSASWADVIAEAQADAGVTKALYLEWADTFTAAAGYTVSKDGPGLIGASPHDGGSSTRPIVSGDFGLVLSSSTNHDFADWRFVDLDVVGTADTATGVGAAGAANYITFLRCRWTDFLLGININISTLDTINSSGLVAGVWTGWCIAECETSGLAENSVLAPIEKLMMLGSKFGAANTSEHPVRIAHCKLGFIWACEFVGTGGQGVPLTIRSVGYGIDDGADAGFNTLGAGNYTENIVIGGNKILGSTGPYIMAVGQRPNDSAFDYRWRNILIDGNWLVQNAAGNQRFLKSEGSSITFRNNLCMCTAATSGALGMVQLDRNTTAEPAAFDDIDVYNNTFYSGETAAQTCAQLDIAASAAPTDVNISNNIAWLDNYGTFLFTSGTFGTGGEHDNSPATNSTSGAGGQMAAESPSFAGSVGDGTGTFTVPTDFMILTGSYGKGAGADGLKNFRDFFGNIRDWETPDTDMGFHAFTTGALPAL